MLNDKTNLSFNALYDLCNLLNHESIIALHS